MSVETTNSSVEYVPDGVNKVWDLTFPIISASDIQVWTLLTDGSSVQITSNFSVNTSTNQVTYPITGPAISPSNVSKIIILRVIDIKQEIVLSTQGPFPAAALNSAHDKLTMIAQQLQEQITRAVVSPIGTVLTPDQYLSALDAAVTEAAASASAALVSELAAQAAEAIAVAAAATMTKATQAQAEAAADDTAYMTALKVKQEVQKVGAVSIPIANLSGLTGSAILALVGPLLLPVGSVVTFGVSTNPATLFGFGTWTAIAGKVVVGIDGTTEFLTLNQTGGEKTHTLTIPEMPAHTHDVPHVGTSLGTVGGGSPQIYYDTGSVTSTSTGGDGAHNNLQPYIVKYVWERTA